MTGTDVTMNESMQGLGKMVFDWASSYVSVLQFEKTVLDVTEQEVVDAARQSVAKINLNIFLEIDDKDAARLRLTDTYIKAALGQIAVYKRFAAEYNLK